MSDELSSRSLDTTGRCSSLSAADTYRAQRAGTTALLPALWLLLYGCALISVSATTRRLIGVMGALFVLLAVPAYLLPPPVPALTLAAGFGGLHLAFGVILRSRSHAGQA